MKKKLNKTLRKLLCSGLIIAMVLFNSIAVFASDEIPEGQIHEDNTATEVDIQETPQAQPASSSETVEPQTQPAASSEPSEPESPAPSPVSPVAEATDDVQVPDQDITTETISVNTEEPEEVVLSDPEVSEEDVSADPEVQEENASADPEVSEEGFSEDTELTEEGFSEDTEVPKEHDGENDNAAKPSDTSKSAMFAAGTASSAAAEKSTVKAAKSSSGKTIHIGDVSFNSGDDESSHWSNGKGWKNIGGQYIAMVDYNGSGAEISADEGVITLAVAGVNRIGTLKGNCSYNIVGSGIVLIDSIEIEDGNGISLMPNTAIYNEGSAAVFLKQDDESYKLINGSVPGILDESYVLDDVKLVVPDGSVLNLNAMCVRTETWVPDVSDEPVTDVTIYTTDMPDSSAYPSHYNGTVNILDYGSRLVIGKNSTFTIDDGAAVHLNGLKTQNRYLGVSNPKVVAELIVQGVLNVTGAIEGGGFIDVQDGGTLSGTGTVRSAEIDLETGGNLNVPLEDSILTIYSNADGSSRVVSPTVKDSIIYLRGSNITLPDLNVSGSSTLSIDTRDSEYDPYNRIGNITLSRGSNLDIVVNKYDEIWAPSGYDEQELLDERDGLTDCFLEIYGGIIGGTVSVLAGCVKYTGTHSDVLPSVPDGYASRVLINENAIESTEDPLNMTQAEANSLAKQSQIPIIGYTVFDDWLTEKGMFRVWRVDKKVVLSPLPRKQVTYPELLELFDLLDDSGHIRSNYHVAVELIYSDFTRDLLKADRYYPAAEISENAQWTPISLDNVIMIRVLEYIATGGFGGSSTTHTMASATGTGVIGSPGSGSMRTGNGAVIYGVKYVEPVPDDPTPDDLTPDDHTQEDPTPVDPTPVDPVPVDPTPVDPSPVDPSFENPTRIDPEKKEDSINKDNNSRINNNNNIQIAGTDSKTIVSAVSDIGFTVNVLLMELTAEETAKYPDIPQIWQLSITDGGMPVTDLSGTPVKVTFPFTVPEDWGDPAEIDKDSLYAVFADENELTAYKAEYDSETGEVSFETEQTGAFVIIQFKYEDEPFKEDFYKALAELKEIKDFLAFMYEERA